MKNQFSFSRLLSCFLIVIATVAMPASSMALVQVDSASSPIDGATSAKQTDDLTDDQQIVSIPVSISTKFKVGEDVKLVKVDSEGGKEIIVEQVKVFRIGEVNMIEREGENIFVRYVSIVTSSDQGAKINEAMKDGNGGFLLQPMNADMAEATSKLARDTDSNPRLLRNRLLTPLPGDTATSPPKNSAPQTNQPATNRNFQTPLQGPDSKVVLTPQQLREVARMFEQQAATLEDRGNYEKADLIREAVKKIREAARIE